MPVLNRADPGDRSHSESKIDQLRYSGKEASVDEVGCQNAKGL